MRFTRNRNDLSPFDAEARRFVDALVSGEPVTLEVIYERDMVEHRKIMAQIADVAKAIHADPQWLRAQLLFETGHFALLGELYGKTVVAVSSMSRHHMKDYELHAFWHDAVEVLRKKVLPQVRDAAERERLVAMLSQQGAPATG
ncbi:hypothetical protein QIH85_23905 [Bradyrhizobium japonicum]|uniref:hypothetical protein n=1 Tax=Bradyrhizobium japonicum TaxID=375 RepID=UPI0027145022|nr:hypothetical protein [Bradyrhizobium japonicum]WLB24928.1 hypothetical protein QIH85_23905 [Bradyrhizobium japonicum]